VEKGRKDRENNQMMKLFLRPKKYKTTIIYNVAKRTLIIYFIFYICFIFCITCFIHHIYKYKRKMCPSVHLQFHNNSETVDIKMNI